MYRISWDDCVDPLMIYGITLYLLSLTCVFSDHSVIYIFQCTSGRFLRSDLNMTLSIVFFSVTNWIWMTHSLNPIAVCVHISHKMCDILPHFNSLFSPLILSNLWDQYIKPMRQVLLWPLCFHMRSMRPKELINFLNNVLE